MNYRIKFKHDNLKNTKFNMPDSSFSIHLYIPGRFVVSAKVQSNSPIGDLRSILPNDDYSFIFNGSLLQTEKTFANYGIRSQAIIVALQVNTDRNETPKWIRITRDSDSFRERVKGIMNHRTSAESARLHDFQLLRMEQKVRSYRKFCFNYTVQNEVFSSTQRTNVPTIITNNSLLEPAIEPLPLLWDFETDPPMIPESEMC